MTNDADLIDWLTKHAKSYAMLTDAAPMHDLDELLSAITPENLHSETDIGHAVGNEFA